MRATTPAAGSLVNQLRNGAVNALMEIASDVSPGQLSNITARAGIPTPPLLTPFPLDSAMNSSFRVRRLKHPPFEKVCRRIGLAAPGLRAPESRLRMREWAGTRSLDWALARRRN
jgi:hypothetical protein